jgi:hypothetical protein
MSTSPIPVPVTWCPPSASWGYGHGTLDAPAFDQHQFAGRRARAISASLNGDGGFDTTGISFGDFGSMHVTKRQAQQVRRLETPSWAMEDAALGLAVLRYCERRLYLQHGEFLTLKERLARVAYSSRWARPGLRKSLKKNLILYHEWAVSQSRSAAQMRRLEIQVHNTESTIQLLERNLMAVTLAVAFCFWRPGWDSVTIAENFGLNSPAVRQMLARVRIVNEKADGPSPQGGPPFNSAHCTL